MDLICSLPDSLSARIYCPVDVRTSSRADRLWSAVRAPSCGPVACRLCLQMCTIGSMKTGRQWSGSTDDLHLPHLLFGSCYLPCVLRASGLAQKITEAEGCKHKSGTLTAVCEGRMLPCLSPQLSLQACMRPGHAGATLWWPAMHVAILCLSSAAFWADYKPILRMLACHA